ncbi:hypothetical protein KOR34_21290 [Posidoniimonas corsicana]|uniref:Uncharacterized protein n=1 Tax=Posidoniimonas corsicana TaxID=1938618 RepID=A0A5C5VHM1_9BACT|nr:hypothetical protein [Posidoniimonas corsicana]TWT37182.1 hypothetical protein KOR34_21290 [Posidoniimonas corsicana]
MNSLDANDLLPGDVLLYRASNAWKNAMSVLIRKLDGTEVSHAGLYLGDEQVGESLIMGNPGLHPNPLHYSIAGCDWVEVRRLTSTHELGAVLTAANRRLSDGSRYGFDQILLVAAICVAHKVNLGDGLLRKIIYGVLHRANEFIRLISSEGREPMICSEFVYRAYDEALLEDDDVYSLAILSQSRREPRRRWAGRRIRERLFAARPETEIPTIEPGSLFARILDEPEGPGELLYATAAPVDVSEAELDAMIYEWTGEQVPFMAGSAAGNAVATANEKAPEVSETQVEALAREFVSSIADAPFVDNADREFRCTAPLSASPAQKALAVIADYVTPGDLLNSPSLETIGRLYP